MGGRIRRPGQAYQYEAYSFYSTSESYGTPPGYFLDPILDTSLELNPFHDFDSSTGELRMPMTLRRKSTTIIKTAEVYATMKVSVVKFEYK